MDEGHLNHFGKVEILVVRRTVVAVQMHDIEELLDLGDRPLELSEMPSHMVKLRDDHVDGRMVPHQGPDQVVLGPLDIHRNENAVGVARLETLEQLVDGDRRRRADGTDGLLYVEVRRREQAFIESVLADAFFVPGYLGGTAEEPVHGVLDLRLTQ